MNDHYRNGYNIGLKIAEDEIIKIIQNINIRKSSNEDFNSGLIDAIDDAFVTLREKLERIVNV